MTTNEFLTLLLSGLALAVSLLTFLIGQAQEKKQMRASVREQLSRVVQDIIAAQGDYAMLDAEPPERRDAGYDARIGSANHRLASLSRQATELTKLEENVGFDVEYIAIANALGTAGDLPAARSNFEQAIRLAPTPYYKAINLRMFAYFLFTHDHFDEARKIFEEAVAVQPNVDDFNRSNNVRIYLEWGGLEAWVEAPGERRAAACFENARQVAQSIGFAPIREAALRDVAVRSAPRRPPPGRGMPETSGRSRPPVGPEATQHPHSFPPL